MSTGRRGRGRQTRTIQPQVLVVTEDTGGAKDYLRSRLEQKRMRDKIVARVIGRNDDPRGLLHYAKRALAGAIRNQDVPDYIFLLFDRDQHAHFDAVIREVHELDLIEAIVSAPCFEYFYLLHFRYSDASMSCFDDVHALLRDIDEFRGFTKRNQNAPLAALAKAEPAAFENAARSRQSCLKSGADGPYTQLDILIEAIKEGKHHGIDSLKEQRPTRDLQKLF